MVAQHNNNCLNAGGGAHLIEVSLGFIKENFTAVDENKCVITKDVSVLFLLIWNVWEELLRDLLLAQLLVHRNQQPLSLGVHVTHLHASLVVEKHMVAFSCGINTHIELLLLGDANTRIRVNTFSLRTVALGFSLIYRTSRNTQFS